LSTLSFSSRAALIASTIPADVLHVFVSGIGEYRKDNSATNPAATSNSGGTKWIPSGRVDPAHWGAICDGVTDDTLAVRGAINYVNTITEKTIYLRSNVSAPGILHSEGTKVNFVGPGDLTSAYRKPTQSLSPRQTPRVLPSNFWNIRALNATSAPIVCLVGDSISTYWANVRTRAGVFSTAIETTFLNQFPSATFHNRAIGGQRLSHFDSKPTTFPEWYTDTGRDWISYVEDITPD